VEKKVFLSCQPKYKAVKAVVGGLLVVANSVLYFGLSYSILELILIPVDSKSHWRLKNLKFVKIIK
jgi:hypothetical protein